MKCKNCNKEFNKTHHLQKHCSKDCGKEYNRKRSSKWKRVYAEKDPDYYKKQSNKFKENNPDYSKDYYHKNKVKICASGRKWRKNNPEKAYEINRRNSIKTHYRDYFNLTVLEANEILKGGCPICPFPSKLLIHHLDGNKNNKSKENYLGMCYNCHQLIHNHLRDMPELSYWNTILFFRSLLVD